MDHPFIYAIYLVPYPAFVGLFLLRSWGRYLLLSYFLLMAVGTFFFGASISGPPETFFNLVAALVDGAILGLAFLSPFSNAFAQSNPPLQTDRPQAAGR
jgi:hypothetical protein